MSPLALCKNKKKKRITENFIYMENEKKTVNSCPENSVDCLDLEDKQDTNCTSTIWFDNNEYVFGTTNFDKKKIISKECEDVFPSIPDSLKLSIELSPDRRYSFMDKDQCPFNLAINENDIGMTTTTKNHKSILEILRFKSLSSFGMEIFSEDE